MSVPRFPELDKAEDILRKAIYDLNYGGYPREAAQLRTISRIAASISADAKRLEKEQRRVWNLNRN